MILAQSTEPVDPQPANPDPLASDKILDIHKLGHPRNGKIAKLPKDQPDDLNQMSPTVRCHTAAVAVFKRFQSRFLKVISR